jgi:glycosyltransferase involved in cell wall biosynthesis
MTSGPVQLAIQQEALPTNTAIRLTSPGPVLLRPLRVLHTAHTSAWSGAEIALVRLIGALDRRLVTPILVCAEDGRLADVARSQNVQTVIEPLSGSIRDRRRRQIRSVSTLAHVPTLAAYARRLARLAKAHQVDVIHTNSLKAFTYGALAGRIAGVPVVAHLRDDLDHLEAGAAGNAVRSLLRRLPAAVVGCSAHVLTAARMTSPRSHVVYTGISREDVADQAVPRRDPPVVGMVARIAPWKGQHLFLQAAAEVAARRPDARFRVIGGPMFGEDAYLRELEGLAAVGPLAGRVEFTGFVADPRAAYERLAVAVATSVTPEPFGKVIIEAMARGVPVVAPSEGGPTEIITHGVDGLLVPPRDPGALASAILRLLDHPGLAAALAEQALHTTRTRFTLEASAERFTDVLLGVVS